MSDLPLLVIRFKFQNQQLVIYCTPPTGHLVALVYNQMTSGRYPIYIKVDSKVSIIAYGQVS